VHLIGEDLVAAGIIQSVQKPQPIWNSTSAAITQWNRIPTGE
jgi:hypothetical protein